MTYRKDIKQQASSNELETLEVELATLLEKVRDDLNPEKDSNFASPANGVAVLGGGLSGLTAALTLLEQGIHVLLIDKNDYFGGNSAYASSGINGAFTTHQESLDINDDVELFYQDTLKSSGRSEDSYTARLARVLADKSKDAVEWVGEAAEVDLSHVGRLGGHSAPRTHRPLGRLSGRFPSLPPRICYISAKLP